VTISDGDGVVVEGLASDAVAALLSAEGIGFTELRRHRASLEEAYMTLTRDAGAVEFAAADGEAR